MARPALTVLFLGELLLAQNDAVPCPPPRRLVVAPEPALPGADVVVPPPPRALLRDTHPVLPPIPVGPDRGQPQPRTAEARDDDPAAGPAPLGTGAFTYFRNRLVMPAGATRSAGVTEPSTALNRDTAWHTGNWYASLSRDGGQTWSLISPTSFFPSRDGGFCCDQRVEHVRSHDLTVWLLQYAFSASTQRGSYVLGVARGRDRLRSGVAADWDRYVFTPQMFGFPTNTWLDFPDVSYTTDWFHVTANVFDENSNFVDSVRWRMSLDDMEAGGPVSAFFHTGTDLGGGASLRLAGADGTQTTGVMFWASNLDTTTIRIWREDAVGTVNRIDRAVAAWSNSTPSCPGPDSRDWMSRADGRIRGATRASTEIVFTWTSARNGSARPRPYTRVARFAVADRSLIAEHDIWSSSLCFAYAAVETNSQNHTGCVLMVGGPQSLVHTSAFLVDNYQSWDPITATVMGAGTTGPASNAWGDYLDVQRHWVDQRTFIGTGFALNGGTGSANLEPRFAWFGRNDYTPAWVSVQVGADWGGNFLSGVPMTIDVTDRNDQKNGVTPFTRSFTPRQGYALTAPQTAFVAGESYVFERWQLGTALQPVGTRTLVVDDMGTTSDSALARYRKLVTLSVDSANPGFGVPITVSVPDRNSNQNGTTGFTRQYLDGAQVVLTAPAAAGANPFKRWILNTQPQPLGQLALTVDMGPFATETAVAEYSVYTPGTVTSFGQGCAGSNGVDLHAAAGVPEIGNLVIYRVNFVPPNSVAIFVLGFSNQSWLGVPLPLPLQSAPGCAILVSVDLTVGSATGAFGIGLTGINFPNDPLLIGNHVYTQFWAVDPGANAAGLTFSNGLDTRVGGVR